MRKIRVAHLITSLTVGGAQSMLYKLVAGMDRSLFESHVISMTDGGTMAPEFEKLGVAVSSLGMRPGSPNPVGVLRLRRLLERANIDVLQTWLYHSDLLGTLTALTLGKLPVLWNIRCSTMGPEHERLQMRVILFLLVRLSQRPTAVVVNSVAGKKVHQIFGYVPRRWELIANGFQLTAGADAAARSALGFAPDDVVFAMVARDDPIKDHLTFLQAARSLLTSVPRARFMLVGEGVTPDTPKYASWAADPVLGRRLHLLGERRDVTWLLGAVDCLVSTSLGEGLPSVVGEAMAAGVPCIATDVGDTARLMADTGILISPGRPRELASAMERMAEDSSLRHSLGTKAKERIERDYSLEAAIKTYENLYRSAVAS
ncbi:MAG: glycosyltransferase [Alphaproteobacteria bacterium]